MDRHRVGIVIPAMNEAATIKDVLKTASNYGTCIVVDDGSTDGTAALARQEGAIVISHPANVGYDAALNSGFNRAAEEGYTIVVTLDADGQHDPKSIDRLLNCIEAGAAVVCGTRDRLQRAAEHAFAWYTRWRYGIPDPLCGMKAYRIEAYRALGHFDSYGSIGTELMLFAARNGFTIASVSLFTRDRVGHSRFGRTLSANWRIFRALLLSLKDAAHGSPDAKHY